MAHLPRRPPNERNGTAGLRDRSSAGNGMVEVRGRPPVTRARVLRYWEAHGPCSVRQICRELSMDRSDVKRILRRFADLAPQLRREMR